MGLRWSGLDLSMSLLQRLDKMLELGQSQEDRKISV
jgi:hypothetical protein